MQKYRGVKNHLRATLPPAEDFMATTQPEGPDIPAAASFRALIESHSRRRLEIAFGQKVDSLLASAEQIALFYQSSFEWLLSSFDLSSAPPELWSQLYQLRRELAYDGLYCHYLLYDFPNRLDFSKIDRDEMHSQWAVHTLTANSFMNTSDKMNTGWPSAIFGIIYARMEDIQKQLGLGWWQRNKNKNKFKNLFASGLLLGWMHDAKTQGLPFPASTT